jgi:probable rRNA maturation factor
MLPVTVAVSQNHNNYLVHLFNRQRLMRLNAASIRTLAVLVLEREECLPNTGINLMFVRDPAISQYNRIYLDKDRATDVISFQAESDTDTFDDERSTGDVIISVDRAVEFAEKNGIPPAEELARYIIHGILHCRGYEDTDTVARRLMLRRQELLLQLWLESDLSPVCSSKTR